MKKENRNDENFHPKYVIYKGNVYLTGNRYHSSIEIFKGRKFFKTVGMEEVEPIKRIYT